MNDTVNGNYFHFDFLNDLAAGKDGNEKLKTCIQCGSCTGSCVAASGMSATPRQLWRSAQMGMESEVIDSMNFWNCTTCGLCDRRCPRGIPLSQIMLSLREKYEENGGGIAGVSQTMDNLRKSRNITGDEPQNRFLWLDNLLLSDQDREKLTREKSDAVFFTGCVGALFPQVGGIPQSLTKLLLKLGADFSLLGEEWCCGYPIMAGGKGDSQIEEYVRHNISGIESKAATKLILTCPTCYYMFAKVYPKIWGKDYSFKVMHYTEYLEELGGIGFKGPGKETAVTYHDPCDLGRKLHITDSPRNLLKGIPGLDFREMRFSGEESKCCGGGGNMEMANADLSLEIATQRLNDALATDAEYLLSSCQQCKRTLQNAARKSRSRIKVMDIIEFMLARIKEDEKEAVE
ncbi:MAG: (Fe-S)-binding protein [Defluviitaleaceae bacterium]|nr:(Fe-S)-binding protein [Defluviitaleaceae bacterium]